MLQMSNVPDLKLKEQLVFGFTGAMNVFQDSTLIKDNELRDAKNIMIQVDGPTQRPGSDIYYSQSGSKVTFSATYYKSDGTKKLLRFALGLNNKMQVADSNGAWSDIGTVTWNPAAKFASVMARDRLWIFSDTNDPVYYDGANLIAYTALSTPTGVTATYSGAAGTTAFSYRVSAVANGETLASTSVTASNCYYVLGGSNKVTVAWTAVSGATSYNIYGRQSGGRGETLMASNIGTTSWVDDGTVTPSPSILPPDANTTTGLRGTMAFLALERIFVAGDPNNPTRLSFGGQADQLGNFSQGDLGGGYRDIGKNDGQKITTIYPFQNGLVAWKERSIYKFYFTIDGSGYLTQNVDQITTSFGGIARRGAYAVENDIIFIGLKDGKITVYSLGNQEGYVSTVLRTNDLGTKINPKLRDVNLAYVGEACSFYYNSIFGFAIPATSNTENNRIWCLDTRFGCWYYWEGMKPTCFVTWIEPTTKEEILLYGDSQSGSMVKMFTDNPTDKGVGFDIRIETKSYNDGQPLTLKSYILPRLQFKEVVKPELIKGETYLDENNLFATWSCLPIVTGGSGLGAFQFGNWRLGDGEAYRPGVAQSTDYPQVLKDRNMVGRSIKFVLTATTQSDFRFKLLSISIPYQALPNKALPQNYQVYTSNI